MTDIELTQAVLLGIYPKREVILFPRSKKWKLTIPVVDIYLPPYSVLTEGTLSRKMFELLKVMEVKPQLNFSNYSVMVVDNLRSMIITTSKEWLDEASKQLPKLVTDTTGLWEVVKKAPNNSIPNIFEFKGNFLQYKWLEGHALEDKKRERKLIQDLIDVAVAVIRPEAAKQTEGVRENVKYEEQVRAMEEGVFGKESDIVFKVK